MKKDIYKLSEWLERLCQEGLAIEHKVMEWKLAEEKTPSREQEAKAG